MLNYLKNLISAPAIETSAAGLTDIGRVRDNNEDCFYIDEIKKLFIVADGMGGHNAGEIASRATVEIMKRHFSREAVATMDLNVRVRSLPRGTRGEQLGHTGFEIATDVAVFLSGCEQG